MCYKPDHWKLIEYNSAGLQTRITSFAETLENFQSLAVDNNKPIYLITPRGERYLDLLRIIQIKDTHEIHEIGEINLKQAMLKYEPDISLF
jgi:hypothetical protein